MRALLACVLVLLLAAPVVQAAVVCAGPAEEACVDTAGSARIAAAGHVAQASCPVGGTLGTVGADGQSVTTGVTRATYVGGGCTTTVHGTPQTGQAATTGHCARSTCTAVEFSVCVPTAARPVEGGVCYGEARRVTRVDHDEWQDHERCRTVDAGTPGRVCVTHASSYAPDEDETDCADASAGTLACYRREHASGWTSSVCAGVELRPETCAGRPGNGAYVVARDAYLHLVPALEQRVTCVGS
ncbi:MAG TPA: hypothetical protein VNX21_00665 [Candidatus Thermoplasmatota archaeon]|nr:hypothetical protein [Candidatus Thermoplasmatota archaeon]